MSDNGPRLSVVQPDDPFDVGLPAQEQAERRVIGVLLRFVERQPILLPLVEPDLFESEPLRMIVSALLAASRCGGGRLVPIEVVAMELERENRLPAVGGWHALASLGMDASTAVGIEATIERLCGARQRRAHCAAARATLAEASDPLRTVAELQAAADARSALVRAMDRSSTESTLSKLCDDGFLEAKRRALAARQEGWSTGLRSLDAVQRLLPGDFWILGGKSSSGKTALALQIAEAVSDQGGKVGMFSLEMRGKVLAFRAMAAECAIPLRRLLVDPLSESELVKLDAARQRMERHGRFVIDDYGSADMGHILAVSRKWHAVEPLSLLLVDYVQMLRPTDPKAVREQQVSVISKALHALAKEYCCVVLGLVQLNRNATDRADKGAQPSDIRDSGQLEHDADVLVFTELDKESPSRGLLRVAKNRNAQRDVEVPVAWDGPTTRFSDVNAFEPQQRQERPRTGRGEWDT